jgi:hypothetical protein
MKFLIILFLQLIYFRVERVEAGLPADKAGLRPGDYIIFVESHNVVTMPEEEILSLIRYVFLQLFKFTEY